MSQKLCRVANVILTFTLVLSSLALTVSASPTAQKRPERQLPVKTSTQDSPELWMPGIESPRLVAPTAPRAPQQIRDIIVGEPIEALSFDGSLNNFVTRFAPDERLYKVMPMPREQDAEPGWITGIILKNANPFPAVPNAPVLAINQPMTRTYTGSADANGAFTLMVQPGVYTVTAGPLIGYPVPNSSIDVNVSSGATETISIFLDPYPYLVEGGVTLDDPAPNGNANGAAEPGETRIQVWQAISNTGASVATNVTAQLFALTPGVTVITDTASYPNIAAGAVQTNTTPFGFSLDGGLACGTTLDFIKVVTTTEGTFTLTFSLDAIIPATQLDPGPVHSYSSVDVPKFIDPPTVVNSTINVLDTYNVYDVDVGVNITHTFDNDLNIGIENPASTLVALSYGNGGDGQDYLGTIFDDKASTLIGAGTAPFSGRFQPEEPLSTYDNTAVNGNWTLHIEDTWPGEESGNLLTWAMTVTEGLGEVTPAHCEWPVPILGIANTVYPEAGGNTNGNGYIDPGENSIDLFVALENTGTATTTNTNSTVIPQQPEVMMNASASTYPDIASGAVKTNTTAYNFAVDAALACGVPLDFEIETLTDQGVFTRSFSLPTGAPPVPFTLLVDDVESGAGVWTTGGDGMASMQITDEESHSPTHAWTEGVTPGTEYVNNADNWFQSPVYDFGAYDSVMMSFWQLYDLEDDFDFGNVEVSRDGGATWETAASYTGYDNWTWTQETVDLGLEHETNARIRFRFTSNADTLGDGWHVDDIEIYGGVRQCDMPPVSWDKDIWVNDMLYTPQDSPFDVMPGDTVAIVDWIQVGAQEPFTYTLVETWTESLDLVDVEYNAGTVDVGTDYIEWTVTDGISSTLYAITKTFEVNDDHGYYDYVNETFTLEGFLPEMQNLVFHIAMMMHKDGPDMAYPGDVIPYTIVVKDDEPIPLDGTLMLTDDLPAGVAYAGNLTFTYGSAWYIQGDNAVYWNNAMGLLKATTAPIGGGDLHRTGTPVPRDAVAAEPTVITITFDVTVTADPGDLVTNIADLSYDGALLSAETTCDVPRPEAAWTKLVYVNDEMVSNIGNPITIVPSDTIVIVDQVDVVYGADISFELLEEWDDSLELVGYELPPGSLQMPGIDVVTDASSLTWTVTDMPADWTYVITKTFNVVEGEWDVDLLTETLTVEYASLQLNPIVLTFEHGFVNTPPVAVDDGYTAEQDSTYVMQAPGVLSNDTDADVGDTLEAVQDTGPTSGTLELSADGSFVYTPTAGFSGVDSFTYHANDGTDDSNVATVSITVTALSVCVEVTSVTLSVAPGTLYTGASISFSADIAPNNADTYTYTVDYDDGTAPFTGTSSDDPLALNHTYADPGSYDVTISVWNCDMAEGEAISHTLPVEVTQGQHMIYLPLVLNAFTSTP